MVRVCVRVPIEVTHTHPHMRIEMGNLESCTRIYVCVCVCLCRVCLRHAECPALIQSVAAFDACSYVCARIMTSMADICEGKKDLTQRCTQDLVPEKK